MSLTGTEGHRVTVGILQTATGCSIYSVNTQMILLVFVYLMQPALQTGSTGKKRKRIKLFGKFVGPGIWRTVAAPTATTPQQLPDDEYDGSFCPGCDMPMGRVKTTHGHCDDECASCWGWSGGDDSTPPQQDAPAPPSVLPGLVPASTPPAMGPAPPAPL